MGLPKNSGSARVYPDTLLLTPLTTIRQPAVELGRHAVRLLRAVIEGEPPKPSKVLLSPELVVRQSA